MAVIIDRPDVDFDAVQHVYAMEGSDLLPGGTMGISTVAKVGGVDDTWGIASAWGFRIGYEGAHALASEKGGLQPFEAEVWDSETKGPKTIVVRTQDDLRAALKFANLTPWATRDKAAERGSWVHDVLEELGQDGKVHDPVAFREKHGEEAEGHARSVMAWFLHFRPSFVAMEVQVASRTHVFAGRYDVRCKIAARRLLVCIDPLRNDPQAERIRELARLDADALCLLDLKTSKGIYPTTHFPQLEGYEGAGVEMGYPATDCRLVLNTWPTGEHDPSRDLAVSWATYDDFLAFLGAMRAIRGIKARDPETIREKAREGALLAALADGPMRSREIADLGVPELAGMDSRAIGFALGGLRKRGKVEQAGRGYWQLVAEPQS